MSVEASMQAGRLLALDLMIDEGTITRHGSGPGVIDPTSGDYTPPASTTVYDGRCRVRKPEAVTQEVVFGDVNTTVSRYLVNLPTTCPPVTVGDVFELTSSTDPEILGVPMRVVSIVGKSVLMYRQLGVEVIEA